MAGFAVGAVSDLYQSVPSASVYRIDRIAVKTRCRKVICNIAISLIPAIVAYLPYLFLQRPFSRNRRELQGREGTYRWHSSLSLKPPSYAIVDSLWFPPCWVHTHETIALVAVEAFCPCVPYFHSVFLL